VTLILTCLTDEVVLQASDQRLTDPKTGAVRDEYANKAIVFDGAIALAYTGISRIPGTRDPQPGSSSWMPADMWMWEVLGQHMDSLPEALRAVTESLSLMVADKYDLAVVGGGWATNNGDPTPIYFRTANFIDAKGDVCPRHTPFTERYEWHAYRSTGRNFLLREAGQRLTLPERAQLTAAIRWCLRKRLGPAQLEGELVKAIRVVADCLGAAGTPLVGRSVVTTALPRAAFLSRDPTFGAKKANLAQTSFRYYPEDEGEPRQHMPYLVLPQLKTMMGGFSIDFSAVGGSGDVIGSGDA